MFANGLCRVNDCGSDRNFNLAANGRRCCAPRKSGFGLLPISGDVRYRAALGGRLAAASLPHMHFDRAQPVEVEAITGILGRKHGLHHAAGHHDLASLERGAALGKLSSEPGD
jgi:hypothetical protein